MISFHCSLYVKIDYYLIVLVLLNYINDILPLFLVCKNGLLFNSSSFA